MQNQKRFFLSKRMVTTITVCLLVIFGSLLWLFIQSQQKITQAEEETRALVNLDYPIKTVNHFYWTSNQNSYFSLDFVDEAGQRRYAIINPNGGDIEYYTPSDIISSDDAVSIAASEYEIQKLLNVRLGMIDQKPVWEVVFNDENNFMTYYFIDAQTGEWLQTIGNL